MPDTHDFDALASAIDAMDNEILLALTPAQAVLVIANLQLALRHPGNDGPSSVVSRSICETLIGSFPMEIRALLDLGFRSEFDVSSADPATVTESEIEAVVEWVDRRRG